MKVFRSILLLSLAMALCLTVTGCKGPNVDETAVPDAVVVGETDNQPEKDQQPQQNQVQQPQQNQDQQPQQNQDQQTQTDEESTAETDTKQEKKYLSVDSSKARLSKEELLAKGHLVVKVLIQSKDAEEMANPDRKAVDSTGTVIDNSLITSYTAEVLAVYKGDYENSSIVVKTEEGRGLSPDLILYGEDENFILTPPLTRFTLEPGKEYVLILVYDKGVNAATTGYFIFGPENGCFSIDEKGVWNNMEPISDVTFEEQTIQSEIASIVSEKNKE